MLRIPHKYIFLTRQKKITTPIILRDEIILWGCPVEVRLEMLSVCFGNSKEQYCIFQPQMELAQMHYGSVERATAVSYITVSMASMYFCDTAFCNPPLQVGSNCSYSYMTV